MDLGGICDLWKQGHSQNAQYRACFHKSHTPPDFLHIYGHTISQIYIGGLTVKKALLCLSMLIVLLAFYHIQCAAAYSYHGPEMELIELINAERAASDTPPLAFNREVARLARYKSEEMKRHGLLEHESLVYGSPDQQLATFNVPYNRVAANIAMGHESSMAVFQAWVSSQSHHANMVNAEYTSAGVGLSVDDDGIYFWTLVLIKE